MHGAFYTEMCAELSDAEEKHAGETPCPADDQRHSGTEPGTVRRIARKSDQKRIPRTCQEPCEQYQKTCGTILQNRKIYGYSRHAEQQSAENEPLRFVLFHQKTNGDGTCCGADPEHHGAESAERQREAELVQQSRQKHLDGDGSRVQEKRDHKQAAETPRGGKVFRIFRILACRVVQRKPDM